MDRAILTIDDVPSRNTPAMVDYLCEKGIRAILFATGRNVERYREEAIYAIRRGMIVGNHSYSHPGFSKLSLAQCIDEIERCEAVLDQLYRDSGVARTCRPFRFPYGDKGGSSKAALQRYFRDKGFDKVDDTHLTCAWWKEHGLHEDVDTFWTFDFGEYRMQRDPSFTADSVWARMHDAAPENGEALFGGEQRHILLLHAHDETEALLPGYWRLFIDHLLEHGMVFDDPRFL